MSTTASLAAAAFDHSQYATTLAHKLVRSVQLGPKYYLFDIPRYYCHRWRLRLPLADIGVLFNPIREFVPGSRPPLPLPPGYEEVLSRLARRGVALTLPPARAAAVAAAWWASRRARGDVIECGSYRGATGLLLASLGRLAGIDQAVHLLDTFAGSPGPSGYDPARRPGEFKPPQGWVERLREQAAALGVSDRVRIHPGLFASTFATLANEPLRFAFVHIDANLYQSTFDACAFTVPRVEGGGVIVFDDYNGPCDLGARLAVDHYLVGHPPRPRALVWSSAYIVVPPPARVER